MSSYFIHCTSDFKVWCEKYWTEVENDVRTIVLNLVRFNLLHTPENEPIKYSWIRCHNEANGSYKEVRLGEVELKKLVDIRTEDLRRLGLILYKEHVCNSVEQIHRSFSLSDTEEEILSKQPTAVSRALHPPSVEGGSEVTLAQLMIYESDQAMLRIDLSSLIIFSLVRGTKIHKAIQRMSDTGRQNMQMLAQKYHIIDSSPKTPTDITMTRIQRCCPRAVSFFLFHRLVSPVGDPGELPVCLAHPYGLSLVPLVGYEGIVRAWDAWHKQFIRTVGITWSERRRFVIKESVWHMDYYTDAARQQLLTEWDIKSDDGRTSEGNDEIEKCETTHWTKVTREYHKLKNKRHF